MAVTQKDIAERLGISQQAVASALSGRGGSRLSETTRSKVLREAELLNYRPNLVARALTRQRTNLIAVWTKNLSSPFYAHLLHHIELQLRSSDYEMIVRVIPEDASSAVTKKWQTTQWPVDGILAIEAAQHAHQFLKTRTGSPLPLVCVGGYDSTVPELDFVWVDLYQGTLEAVQHLLAQGCQRVATLIHGMGFKAGNPRHDAYVAVMEAAGRTPEFIVVPETTRAASQIALQTYVSEHGCPDGLFCYNDDLAIGAYRFLRKSGREIPKDVALVGCDGIEDVEYLEQPLSTIITPIEEMCSKAWKLLQRRMDDSAVGPQHEVLPSHLTIRNSSQRK
ncbi:LacI family transcriptional regulator [bacterium]|nr:MAG: LacI family transcriptional regulator [bacterium]